MIARICIHVTRHSPQPWLAKIPPRRMFLSPLWWKFLSNRQNANAIAGYSPSPTLVQREGSNRARRSKSLGANWITCNKRINGRPDERIGELNRFARGIRRNRWFGASPKFRSVSRFVGISRDFSCLARPALGHTVCVDIHAFDSWL